MATPSAQPCPSCGTPLPPELAQHAQNLVTATVRCPECGTEVSLREGPDDQAASAAGPRAEAAPPGRTEGAETFSGSETAAGVADELRRKPT